MKQKMVIKVYMACDKCRSKAMGLVASTYGVQRVEIEGDSRDQLAVVGDGVDSADLTRLLRRKMGNAQLLKVEAVASAEARPAPPPVPETGSNAVAPCPQQWYPPGYGGNYSWPAAVYPYTDGHCHRVHLNPRSW